MHLPPSAFLVNALAGAVFAAAIALAAHAARALTRGGAIAAFVVGTVTFAAGSIGFTLILLAFFVPSVVLSRIGKARKRELVDVGKGGPRDALQVLANGGVATVCAAAWGATGLLSWAFAFAGAYAAATADTWATEIGTLARRPPRSILTLRPIPPGLSGGVTLPGTLAEIGGALWLGLAGLLGIALAYAVGVHPPGAGFSAEIGRLYPAPPSPASLLCAIPLAGIAGATLDSVLGATLQELRRCDACGRSCETDPHACGAPTRRVRGVRGFSNDLVNALATLAGAAVAFALSGFGSL